VGNGNGTITPDVTASRGEIAAVFHRFLSLSDGNNADSLRQTGK
jgi:hypothetical protein